MSWETLRDIRRENAQLEARAAALRPSTCPIDGSLLQERDGVLNCPMGNYRREGSA